MLCTFPIVYIVMYIIIMYVYSLSQYAYLDDSLSLSRNCCDRDVSFNGDGLYNTQIHIRCLHDLPALLLKLFGSNYSTIGIL